MLQHSDGNSDTASGDAEPYTNWPSCSEAHAYESYPSETSSWDTECAETDEDVYQPGSISYYYGGRSEDERKIPIHHKTERKRRELFGGPREKNLDAR